LLYAKSNAYSCMLEVDFCSSYWSSPVVEDVIILTVHVSPRQLQENNFHVKRILKAESEML
jgi:hypothetical protein